MIKTIDSAEMLDELFERSKSEPVVIFKHSNSCGISSHVLEMITDIESDLNVIVIQENRDLSDNVAVRTGYAHQSPQVFVLVNGEPTYHATHYGINQRSIEEAVASNLVAN